MKGLNYTTASKPGVFTRTCRVVKPHQENGHTLGLRPGGSSQHSMYWLCQMLGHWTQTMHCFGEAETRRDEAATHGW